MKRLCTVLFLLGFAFFSAPSFAQAQEMPEKYFRGEVLKILQEQKIPQEDENFYVQEVQVKRLDNKEIINLTVGSEFQPLNEHQRVRAGTSVILAEQEITPDQFEIVIVDIYRAPIIFWLLGGFFLLVVFVAKWQGFLSIVGMMVSLGILSMFIVPRILTGDDPILITMIGSFGIAALTIYLSHGWSFKSHIALASMMGILGVVAVLSVTSVYTAQVVGLGSEEAYFLQFGQTANINLQGLLLGGILLGALGVLDDICVSQASIVFELKSVKKDISFSELYHRALTVGKDHVASLVNTLVLAYAGANLPLFILFSINNQIPRWVTLNSEIILEEVIRTLAGSIGLVLAVPITTLIAALVAQKVPLKKLTSGHHHHHTHS
jgi:uncharacterized membrane protein